MAPILTDNGLPWLSIVFALPAVGAAALMLIGHDALNRRLALIVSLAAFLCSFPLLSGFDRGRHAFQFVRLHAWIPQLHVNYAVGVDGVSLSMLLLVTGFMPLCVVAAWRMAEGGGTACMTCLLALESALIGCLVALDFVLLALCWMGLLAPLAFLIALCDDEDDHGGRFFRADFRSLAAARFFFFGLAGSIPLLLAGVVLARESGTFFIPAIMGRSYGAGLQVWVFAAVVFACSQRLPLPPLRGWFPPALSAAPTAAAIALAVLAPLPGLYGLLRLASITPDACQRFSGALMWLGAIGLLLGGFRALGAALAGEGPKSLVAGFAPAWMGLAVLGVFSGTRLGQEGAMFAVPAQGLAAAGLLLCGRATESGGGRLSSRPLASVRANSRAIGRVLTFFFALAGAAVPGTGLFPAVLATLAAILGVEPTLAFAALPGLMLLAVALCLGVAGKSGFRSGEVWNPDSRELAILVPLALALLVMGLAPQTVLDFTRPALDALAQALPDSP